LQRINMKLNVIKTELRDIKTFRSQFLEENNFQFICNKCHDYGWADTYLFLLNNEKIGYGSVWGTDNRNDRDTIFEFYLLQPYRKHASLAFVEFHSSSGTKLIEAQSNDLLFTSMLYEFAENIHAEAILFKDEIKTNHAVPGADLRRRLPEDNLTEDDGEYVLEYNGEIAATGGLMLNYNFPYADIYMAVKPAFRQKGLGSLLVQEIKAEAYKMGRVPAARCNIQNGISKATLLKAGFGICGYRLKGEIKKAHLR
jgi:GNAT superfamily N-acetyltransferase